MFNNNDLIDINNIIDNNENFKYLDYIFDVHN